MIVGVFLQNSDEEMSEMWCDEYPVRTKQKITCKGKDRGRKLAKKTTNNYGCYSSNISLNS